MSGKQPMLDSREQQSLSATSVEQNGHKQAPLSGSATHRELLGPMLFSWPDTS